MNRIACREVFLVREFVYSAILIVFACHFSLAAEPGLFGSSSAGGSAGSSQKACDQALSIVGEKSLRSSDELVTTKSASDSVSAKWDTVFKAAYSDRSIYEPGRCHENVYRLLKKYGELDPKVRVVAFFARDRKAKPMLQFSQRSGEEINEQGVSQNFHHVVVIREGLVYDLSHQAREPVSVEEYFAQMYAIDVRDSQPHPDRKLDWSNNLVAKEIPVEDFLREENSLLSYRKVTDPTYPVLPIHLLLSNPQK